MRDPAPAPEVRRPRAASGFPEPIWPTPAQELLLRAALERGESALAAWRAWQRLPQPELDPESAGLLPLLHANLRRLELDDPCLEPLARIHQGVRETNEQRLQEAVPALRELARAGIDTLVLKGGSLLSCHYRDLGARPLGDVDVAVAHSDARRAMAALARAGFSPNKPVWPSTLRFRHSANFANRTGTSLDLHWHVLFESCRRGDDEEFWRAALPHDFSGIATRVLAPEDLLLGILAHGVKWGTAPNLHWIPDALTLVREAGDRIDWERLVRQAARCRVAQRTHAGLRYLATRLGAEIPAPVLARLGEIPASAMERAESALRLVDPESVRRRLTGALELVLVDYWRLKSGGGWLRALRELPAYLHFRYRRFRHAIVR